MSAPTSQAVQNIFKRITKEQSKGRNFLDVCFGLPDQGVGHRLTKTLWPERESYWTVTRVRFTKNSGGRTTSLRGAAYGILTWGGKTDERERKVMDILQRKWTTFPYEFQKAEKKTETTEPTEAAVEGEQQQQN
ncbi:hypothetical protein DFA_07367 [Cavenderia fasciculata]|uniref:Uncharacterized protein n=1 Tax=Cavenderia fasciculata TaxID=261658 RepID=F4PW80_CACFS|nr:uncharacterized protein DFA_07367 [Cavenderia fasciculata]EGG20244.1 hypothetical protein DFA_07367 [Cavenderia fasciculata]|eukprot:XP_004367227.1 hypothetical protein DFA_07367 [Cavenderia fasciculata]